MLFYTLTCVVFLQVSEDAHSTDMAVHDDEHIGFYTETFHSSAWIYQGDDVSSGEIRLSLKTRARPVSSKLKKINFICVSSCAL